MVLGILVASAVLLIGVGKLYSGFLSRQFGEDVGRPTPAVRLNDGRDYVPTPTPVVFAHHFASIAGAGPIVGPVLAICYGWGPAVVWVLVGGLFVGAVHDYLATYMSTRNDGQSIATIARRLLGRGPFIALVLFLLVILGLVCAVFLNLSATALTSLLPLARMELPADQTLFRLTEDGTNVVIGGIASTSVIVITLVAPLIGWLYLKRKVSVWICSMLALGICSLSIAAGVYWPVSLPAQVTASLTGTDLWKLILAAYVLIAAGVPVWIFLQSRDFINVHILYIGMAALMVTLGVAAIRTGPPANDGLPMMDLDTGTLAAKGLIWPFLFITIACGAVSGFHSLCAGGTTSKQLDSELAARRIGYGGMLLETFLAVCVICVMMLGLTRCDYLLKLYPDVARQLYPELAQAAEKPNAVVVFALAVGSAAKAAFGSSMAMAIGAVAGMVLLEGFLVTTLDTAVRLMRYLLEEIWRELFGRYDVFAGKSEAAEAVVEAPAGSGGVPAATPVGPHDAPPRPIVTSGAFRTFLRFIGFYWVNSGLAVGITLLFAFSGGILKLWPMFGASNQLLAAMTLGLGSIWLLRQGRRVWYVVWPAVFMLATTVAALVQMLMANLPSAQGGNPVLFGANVVVILLTAYIVFCGVRELLGRQPVPAAAD